MSYRAKIGFFLLAVAAMGSLATASVFMAENFVVSSVLLFALSVVLMGIGFGLRKQLVR